MTARRSMPARCGAAALVRTYWDDERGEQLVELRCRGAAGHASGEAPTPHRVYRLERRELPPLGVYLVAVAFEWRDDDAASEHGAPVRHWSDTERDDESRRARPAFSSARSSREEART